ncbi:MAG TPA: DUF1615 domain-containing protein [Steroidobacteraceae bacterium]|jgi:hypothetical protein|nr:DUF1615 domain-containing protein [Steroidobacteraceae bacterium]
MHQNHSLHWVLGSFLLLGGCAGEKPAPTPALNTADAKALIEQSLPRHVSDRAGWTADMYAAFTALTVTPTPENICAVDAVIEQESGFRVDPVVPGLGPIARKEIETRAARAHVPLMLVNGVLQLKSSDGRTYGERIDAARTEKDLSDAYEDLIGAVPLGKTLFAERNPIRTRGPMQVNVAFAEQFSSAATYPYPVPSSIADELFTRRGSVYFGIAHLLDYRAPYDQYLYRFADFNAGQYASRNAAFQSALSVASGIPLAADGALLPHDSDPNTPGATELAARTLAVRLKVSNGAIHSALAEGRTRDFESTPLYQRVFALAEQRSGLKQPHALVPRIKLVGPKIKRSLTTDWYAHRVDDRFKRCLSAT